VNSIAHGVVAQTLTLLHKEADATDAEFIAKLIENVKARGLTIEQFASERMASEREDYREILQRNSVNFLAVSPDFGRFVYMLARARKATRIVEFGASMGISTIYLAAALRDNGGGHLISSEFVPAKVDRARKNLALAGLADLVEIREGDAMETLKDVGNKVDLLFIDGAFSLYLPVLKLVEPQLNPGAVVLAENAFDKAYVDYVRDPVHGYISVALTKSAEDRGNEFSVRVGW
jgi:predicted O-methyltransferase YrrM